MLVHQILNKLSGVDEDFEANCCTMRRSRQRLFECVMIWASFNLAASNCVTNMISQMLLNHAQNRLIQSNANLVQIIKYKKGSRSMRILQKSTHVFATLQCFNVAMMRQILSKCIKFLPQCSSTSICYI